MCQACSVTHRQPLVSGNASLAVPTELVDNTFCFVVRNFSGYFHFSRCPGRLELRRMLAVPIGRRLLMGMAGLNCWECPRRPPLSRSSSSVVASAFVASVPGKDRQSLAFSRWPGGMESLRKLADLIGRQRRVSLTLRLFSRFTLLARVCCRSGSPGRPVFAFVASVPGKSRQSLFFGLYGFGVL